MMRGPIRTLKSDEIGSLARSSRDFFWGGFSASGEIRTGSRFPISRCGILCRSRRSSDDLIPMVKMQGVNNASSTVGEGGLTIQSRFFVCFWRLVFHAPKSCCRAQNQYRFDSWHRSTTRDHHGAIWYRNLTSYWLYKSRVVSRSEKAILEWLLAFQFNKTSFMRDYKPLFVRDLKFKDWSELYKQYKCRKIPHVRHLTFMNFFSVPKNEFCPQVADWISPGLDRTVRSTTKLWDFDRFLRLRRDRKHNFDQLPPRSNSEPQ